MGVEGFHIRQLVESDWEEIVGLEERAYSASGLSDGSDALRARGRSSPTTCFVLDCGGAFGGYLLTLPYPHLRCPELSLVENSEFHTSNLHVHDMVIMESARGQGLAPRLLGHAADTARLLGFETISLVAVHGTDLLWSPLGYHPHPEVTLPASYGADAVYMSMGV